MTIALYTRQTDPNSVSFVEKVIESLLNDHYKVIAYRTVYQLLDDKTRAAIHGGFQSKEDLVGQQADFLFSIGGDGTFIDAANLIGDSGIPILGINTGRIGFLTHVNRNNFTDALLALRHGDFQLEHRFLLQVSADNGDELPAHFALNDISIHPHGESINAIRVRANGKQLNTYWGDGIIVATPTGSTAYSLSCGGPILVPDTDVIALTPIASHSLTVRPIVLPASDVLTIKVESRSHRFILAVDSHRAALEDGTTLTVRRAPYTIQTIRLRNADFYSVIREKLLWGQDKRGER